MRIVIRCLVSMLRCVVFFSLYLLLFMHTKSKYQWHSPHIYSTTTSTLAYFTPLQLLHILFCLHFLALGFLVDFISVPVVSAFTSATSLIIIGAQLKNLLGIEYSSKGFADSVYMLIERLEHSVFWDAVLAAGCCIFLLALRVRIEFCSNFEWTLNLFDAFPLVELFSIIDWK